MLILIIGLSLLLYPTFSDWWNDLHSSYAIANYDSIMANMSDDDYAHLFDAAMAYNMQLRQLDYPLMYYDAVEGYEDLLNITGTGIIGYINIDKIDVQLPIYHGTGADSLERGIGHLLGSSLPIGGKDTHSILTAHSGMATQKMCSDLPQLAVGDVFYLNVLGETLAYQVNDIHTVLPYDTTYLGIEQDKDLCTLVTCTPFGINTHRLLVRGFRIPYEEAEVIEEITVQEEVTSTWEQQYVKGLLIGLGVVLLIVIIVLAIWLVRRYRYERR